MGAPLDAGGGGGGGGGCSAEWGAARRGRRPGRPLGRRLQRLPLLVVSAMHAAQTARLHRQDW